MCRMISVLVSKGGRVFAKDGVHSHSGIAEELGLCEDQHLKYEFPLEERKLVQDFTMDGAPFEAKASHDAAAQAFFDECAGTPEKLVEYVKRGNWDAESLARLLSTPALAEYDKACTSARVEYNKARDSALAEYNKACTSAWAEYKKVCAPAWAEYKKVCAPALAEYNKTCASARAEYKKVCTSAWVELFLKRGNRITAWK